MEIRGNLVLILPDRSMKHPRTEGSGGWLIIDLNIGRRRLILGRGSTRFCGRSIGSLAACRVAAVGIRKWDGGQPVDEDTEQDGQDDDRQDLAIGFAAHFSHQDHQV